MPAPRSFSTGVGGQALREDVEMLWRRLLVTCIACLSLAAVANAQVPPAAPPAAAAVVAATPPGAVAAAAPAPGFCEQCWLACEACKRRLCEMPLGGMLNAMTKPFSGMSGGIIPNFCPITPSAQDLAKPGAEGAAAVAKADALAAKARRASVRYLGTLDCRYYPEAEAALIAALRTDGVECVRWEAAMALGRSCCCNKRVMAALTITVNCSEADGNPAELSERVRMAAAVALDRCLACYVEVVEAPVKVEDPLKEKGGSNREGPGENGAAKSSKRPDKQTVASARAALKKFYGKYGVDEKPQATESVRITPVPTNVKTIATPVPPPVATNSQPQQTRQPRSLLGVLRESFASSSRGIPMNNTQVTVMYDQTTQPVVVMQPPPTMKPHTSVLPNAVAASKVQTPGATTPAPTPAPAAAMQPSTYILFDPPAPAPKK
jgi:hypothetical protein